MARAVTLLTLDAGSVLYNPAQMPDEIVLKHTDGELIKTKHTGRGTWQSLCRDELEVNFWVDGEYDSPLTAVATLADRQAFGFRLNGEAVNPLAFNGSKESPETIEVEGLRIGGVVIESKLQLPLAVYTTDEVYYRVFISADNDSEGIGEEFAVLEIREGPRGDWEEVSRSEPTEPGYLANEIAETTGMEAVSGSAQEMQEMIDKEQDLYKASYTEEDDMLRERMAVQNYTAFPPSTPKPRPVNFPLD